MGLLQMFQVCALAMRILPVFPMHVGGLTLKTEETDNGCRVAAVKIAPQGAVISPLLANIYRHYVLDPWSSQRGKRNVRDT